MNVALYVDGEYLHSAAYHWGVEHGVKRAKADYQRLMSLAMDQDEGLAVVTVARIYLAPGDHSRTAGFVRRLKRMAYEVTLIERKQVSRDICAKIAADINQDVWEYEPDAVVIVTGNGLLAPLCRALAKRTKVMVVAFEGSLSTSLKESCTQVKHLTLDEIYDASK